MQSYYPFYIPDSMRRQELTYIRKPQDSWTEDWIDQELPLIMKMKGVDKAWRERSRSGKPVLLVQTSGQARHPKKWRNMASVIVKIYHEPGEQGVALKYASQMEGVLNPHPTIHTRIGYKRFLSKCIGDYVTEINLASRQSPYMAAVASLSMLQTIVKGDTATRPYDDNLIDPDAVRIPVVILAVCAWFYIIFSIASN